LAVALTDSSFFFYQVISTDKNILFATLPAVKSAQTIPWILGIFRYTYLHFTIIL